MDFFLEPKENTPEHLVSHVTVRSHRGGLQLHWGINNFGFGSFSFYIRDGKTFCNNEMCSSKIVSTVLKKAVWDMVYNNFEVLESHDYPLSQEEAQKIFNTGEAGLTIYREANSREVVSDKLIVSYFPCHDLIKKTLVFNNKTFPDLIDVESADSVLSHYLGQKNWDSFITSFQTISTKTLIKDVVEADNEEKVISASFEKSENEGIKIKWESNKDKGIIHIKNHAHVPSCTIDTPKAKLFVMDVLDKAMESVILNN